MEGSRPRGCRGEALSRNHRRVGHFAAILIAFPNSKLIDSGDLDKPNARDYLRVGALVVAADSSVLSAASIEAAFWDEIIESAREFIDALSLSASIRWSTLVRPFAQVEPASSEAGIADGLSRTFDLTTKHRRECIRDSSVRHLHLATLEGQVSFAVGAPTLTAQRGKCNLPSIRRGMAEKSSHSSSGSTEADAS